MRTEGRGDAIRTPESRKSNVASDVRRALNRPSVETTGWEPALLTCFKRQDPLSLALRGQLELDDACSRVMVTDYGGWLRNFFQCCCTIESLAEPC